MCMGVPRGFPRSSSALVHRSLSDFLVVELVVDCAKFIPHLRLPSHQRIPSSNLGLVHLFRGDVLVFRLERLPQGNLWCEFCPFSRSIWSCGLQDA